MVQLYEPRRPSARPIEPLYHQDEIDEEELANHNMARSDELNKRSGGPDVAPLSAEVDE